MTGPNPTGPPEPPGKPPFRHPLGDDDIQVKNVTSARNGVVVNFINPGSDLSAISFSRAWLGERERWVAVIQDPDQAAQARRLLNNTSFMRGIARSTGEEGFSTVFADAVVIESPDVLDKDTFAPHRLAPAEATRLARVLQTPVSPTPAYSPLRVYVPGLSGFVNPRLPAYRQLVHETDIEVTGHQSVVARSAWNNSLVAGAGDEPTPFEEFLRERLHGKVLVDGGGHDHKRLEVAARLGASGYVVVDRFAYFGDGASLSSRPIPTYAIQDDLLCTVAGFHPRSTNVLVANLDHWVISNDTWHARLADELARVLHPQGTLLVVQSAVESHLRQHPDLVAPEIRGILPGHTVFIRR